MKFNTINFPAVTFCNLNPYHADRTDLTILIYMIILRVQLHNIYDGYNNGKLYRLCC